MFRRHWLTPLIALAFALGAGTAHATNFVKPASPALVSGNALASAASLSRVVTFHEGTGATLHELAGNNNFTTSTGGTTGALTWHTGDPTVGTYLTFNGGNQLATGSDTGMGAGTTARTCAVMFRTTSTNIYGLCYGSGSGDNVACYGIMNWAGGNFSWGVTTATINSEAANYASVVTDNVWHIATIVIPAGANPTVKVYVDGALVGSSVMTNMSTTLSGTAYIGAHFSGAAWWNGDLAGMWFWNSALTATQVAAHYNGPWQMVGGPVFPSSNAFSSVQAGNWSSTSTWSAAGITAYPWQKQGIGGVTASPNGAIRVNLSGTTDGPNPGWANGNGAYVENVGGTTEANAPGGTIPSKRWSVNVIDPTHLDLRLPFVATHGAGGTAIRTGDTASVAVKAVAADTSGGILATLTGTTNAGTPGGAWAVGQKVTIAGVGTDVNGTWIIDAVGTANAGADATIVLASVFTNAYTSGGTISRDDVVTINHNVVADATVQGGNDIASVVGITLGSAATLTIGNGATVTCRAPLLLNNGSVALRGGSTLLVGVAVNGPTGFFTSVAGAKIVTTTDGTAPSAGNRATLGTAPGTTSWFVGNSHDFIQLNLAYANVTGGTASTPMLQRDTGVAGIYDASWQFDHVTFNGCGSIGATGNPAAYSASTGAGTYSFTNCTWTGSVATPLFWKANLARAGAASTRQIVHCYFDAAPTFSGGLRDTTVEDSIFNSGWYANSADPPSGDATSFARNLVRISSGTSLGYVTNYSMTDCYHLNTEAGQGNSFFIQPASALSITLLRNTFDAPFLAAPNGQAPDCFYPYDTATTGIVYKLSYGLSLPVAVGWSGDSYQGKGTSSGSIQSAAGLPSGNIKFQIDHNTSCSRTRWADGSTIALNNDRFGPFLNEGLTSSAGASAAGTIDRLTNNLFWDDAATPSGNFGFTSNLGGGPWPGPDNALSVTNTTTTGTHHNAFFHMATTSGYAGKTSQGTYYSTPTTGTIPGYYGGVNTDVTLISSPNFVDPTRSFLKWGRSVLGLTGRTDAQAQADVESAMAMFTAMNNDSGVTAGATVTALNTYVRAGFVPRNANLKAKASDGTEPGAMIGSFGNKVPIIIDTIRHRRIGLLDLTPSAPDAIDHRRRIHPRKAA